MTKKLIALLPLLLVGVMLLGQGVSKQKLSKEERKAAKKAKQEEQLNAILEAIEGRNFVIEANTFTNRRGLSTPINPTLNFVAIQDEDAVIQLASGNGIGLNGLGGITTDGRITKFEIIEKKKGINLSLRVFGSVFGATDLFLNVNASGNASIRVLTLNGGRFSFNGQFQELEDSTVFQGSNTY